VLYSPHFDALWKATGDSLHATLLSLLQDLPPLSPVLFLATTDKRWHYLPAIMKELFSEETGQVERFKVYTYVVLLAVVLHRALEDLLWKR